MCVCDVALCVKLEVNMLCSAGTGLLEEEGGGVKKLVCGNRETRQ